MRRRRLPRSPGTTNGSHGSTKFPSLLLLLFMILAPSLAAHAQSTWIFSQANIDGGGGTPFVAEYSIKNRRMRDDPLPAGQLLRSAPVRSMQPADTLPPESGGLAVDRFHHVLYVTNGDISDLRFQVIPIDDPSGEQQVVVQGSPPNRITSDITGVAIMYGRNDRPKWMWVTSWTWYTYIDMRNGWEWAPRAWDIPFDESMFPVPVSDIAFAEVDIEDPIGVFTKYPALYAVDPGSIITVWDPLFPIKNPEGTHEPLFITGGRLFNPTGIAVDTSYPIRSFVDYPRRIQSGSVLVFGLDVDNKYYIRDADNRVQWEVDVSSDQTFLGMDYSAEIVDMMPHLPEPAEPTGVGMAIDPSVNSPKQPLMPVVDGGRKPMHVRTEGAAHLQGYRAFFVAQLNSIALLQSKDGEGPVILDPTANAYRLRGSFDGGAGEFLATFDPESLPSKPLPHNQQYYYFGQWVFVPPQAELGFGRVPEGLVVSDLYRIAVSHTE